MDTLRLLLWLSIAATVLQVYCAADPLEGKENGQPKAEGLKKIHVSETDGDTFTFVMRNEMLTLEQLGCVVGPSRPCGENNQFRCRQILKHPENGGTPCPPEVERNDPDRPAETHHQCIPGSWSGCFPLPGHPSILVRIREPEDRTADMSTCPHLIEACFTNIPINCVMTDWSVWHQFVADGVEVRVRFVLIEPQHGGTACPHDMEVRHIGTGGCTYNGFTAWIPFAGGCYRYRLSTNGCVTDYEVKAAPCGTGTGCEPWNGWGNWVFITGGPYTCTEERTRNSAHCADIDRQFRSCTATCPWTYTAWGIYTLDPCRQIRFGTNPCYPTITEYRDCLGVCAVPPMSGSLQSRGVPLEGPATSGHLGKRNEPWCPEEMWIIWGRSDGCTAVTNGTYYMCTETVCQDCAAPAASGLICIPNKLTELTIYLENCPGVGTDTMVVTRPLECTCHQVVADTCTEFDGDCA